MISHPQTFIFLGRSGSGKGTQAALLKKYIEEHDAQKRPVFYLESGAAFRNFFSQSHYTAKLSQKVVESGALQPSFLAIYIWAHLMIEQMDEGKHLIVDGTPRLLDDTKIFDSAMHFYGRVQPTLVYINVSKEWSRARIFGRGRVDDKKQESVEKRLAWFDSDVIPTIEHFKNNPMYRYIEINGEQSIEDVHKEILAKGFA
ncbi:MAG: nucleoside monophosphate kinase [Candidatus Pacebacteria bacterium]|nr:nucleoside monophosphate kinase [Candidatus Paceibacterota bacterium]